MKSRITKSNLTFQRFFNVKIMNYSIEKQTHETCLDIDSKSILIFSHIFQISYSNTSIFFMTRSKRLRCHEIDAKSVISNLCVNISLRFLDKDESYAIVIEEVHIILDFSCEMIIDVELMKSKDMIII